MVATHNKQKIFKKKKKVGENAKGSTRICELSVTTSWKVNKLAAPNAWNVVLK